MTDKKDLDKVLSDINKKFGSGSVYRFGDGDGKPTEYIPTGSLAIDQKLGGGVVRGRMMEFYGEFSSGKSTAALHVMAEAQKMGMEVAYVDGEHSFDPDYASQLGVDVDNMFYIAPYALEDSLEITRQLVEAGMFIVYDSTNSLPLRAETDDNDGIGSHHVGREGKIFSQACRMINPQLEKYGSTIIWISQLRANIGAMGYGSKHVIGRGNALKFYASTRIQFTRTGSGKSKGDKVSNIVKVVVTKNKKGIQFAETTVEIAYGMGYDKVGEIVDIAVDYNLVDKRGAWFKLIDTDGVILAKGQGKINFIIDLENNPEILEQLRSNVVEKMNE